MKEMLISEKDNLIKYKTWLILFCGVKCWQLSVWPQIKKELFHFAVINHLVIFTSLSLAAQSDLGSSKISNGESDRPKHSGKNIAKLCPLKRFLKVSMFCIGKHVGSIAKGLSVSNSYLVSVMSPHYDVSRNLFFSWFKKKYCHKQKLFLENIICSPFIFGQAMLEISDKICLQPQQFFFATGLSHKIMMRYSEALSCFIAKTDALTHYIWKMI